MRHKHCPSATWKRCSISFGEDTQAVVGLQPLHAVQGFRADVIVSPSPCFVFCRLPFRLLFSLVTDFVTCVWLKFAAHAKHFTDKTEVTF